MKNEIINKIINSAEFENYDWSIGDTEEDFQNSQDIEDFIYTVGLNEYIEVNNEGVDITPRDIADTLYYNNR